LTSARPHSMSWQARIPLQAIPPTPRPLPTWEDIQRLGNSPLETGLYLVKDVPESKADIIFVSDIYSPLVVTSTERYYGYTLGQAFTSFGFRRDGFWLQRDIAPRVRGCRMLVYHFAPAVQFQTREEACKMLLEFWRLYSSVSFRDAQLISLDFGKVLCFSSAWTRWSHSHGC
jgi:hypothetical protein